MKLKDLIEALAAEIDSVRPQLDKYLADLSPLDNDSPVFLQTLDMYTGQVQRMGEATELAGFPGLNAVCNHVLENALLLAATPVGERQAVIDFLQAWPPLMVHHLRNLEDPSTAAGLLDCMNGAPHPLDQEYALRIMHQLGGMPAQVGILNDPESQRATVAKPEDVALEVPADVDQRLMEGFFQEAPEQGRHLVDLVRKLIANEADADDLSAAKRVAHTLKGSGSIIGLRGLTSLGHHFEDILEYFEKQGGHAASAVADVLMDAAYCLEQMVGYVTGSDDYPQQAQAVLQAVLNLANRIDNGEDLGAAAASVPAAAPDSAAVAASAGAPSAGGAAAASPRAAGGGAANAAPAAALRVSLDRIEELFRVSAEVSVHTAAMENRIKLLTERAKELLEQNLRVQKRLFELETVVDVRALTLMRAHNQREADAAFDPLEMDQYNELHSTAHALVEDAADARVLSQRIEEDIAGLSGMQTRQQLLARDLQHLVIGTRMTEVQALESRLQRNIRTTSQATGKQARLELKGGHTLIDSDVLSKLGEPLLHLLRNAVDHGLESPPERTLAGKPEVGTITLEFFRQGQQVVLRCQDDGRGLDSHAIQKQAIERGLIAPNQAMSADDINRLIFVSGFSTRDQVSEVSGRGVGMDVVREWVNSMQGTVRVSSVRGQGTTIELRFAASLSTMQSLIFEVCEQRFALASVHVEQAVPRGAGKLDIQNQRLLFHFNRRVMPAYFFHDFVGLPRNEEDDLNQYDIIIAHIQDRVMALAVDKLTDSRELLVKNPGRYARHARGVSGLSILGDGSIAAHIDLPQLLDQQMPGSGASVSAAAGKALPRKVVQAPGVLIVDDALSVRNTLQELVQDAGFRTQTARDGLEAINALQTFTPAAILTDMEMPNMNGVELTGHLRRRTDTQNTPIIMITSRSQDKHRMLAEKAGVNAYITKPYNETDLLATIRNLISEAAAK